MCGQDVCGIFIAPLPESPGSIVRRVGFLLRVFYVNLKKLHSGSGLIDILLIVFSLTQTDADYVMVMAEKIKKQWVIKSILYCIKNNSNAWFLFITGLPTL